MKALSIRQPWAWAILHAGKRVENRTWRCGHRGWLLIHASGGRADRGALAYLNVVLAQQTRLPLRLEDERRLQRGAIVGAARVDEWDWVSFFRFRLQDLYTQQRLWVEGPACVVLGEVRALPEPVPCKGRLGLWTVPAGVLAGVASQLNDELRNALLSS